MPLTIMIAVLCIGVSQTLVAAEPFSEIFGYSGKLQGGISDFPNWQALAGHIDEQTDGDYCGSNAGTCPDRDWHDLLEGLQGARATKQLKAVNRFVNGFTYVEDVDNYGQQDYWAAPADFLANGGDCEDFAILKMASLLKLGWPSSALRIVVVQDTAMKQPHAVLAVSVGADVWVLDNQRSAPAQDIEIENYAPVYALSDVSWWLYAPVENSHASPASR